MDISQGDKTRGFTLVEMLTVLVIIGLMSSAVILTFPEKKSDVQVQAHNLLLGVNSLSEDALISGHSTALGLSRKAYAFYIYNTDGWRIRDEVQWVSNARPELMLSDERFELTDELSPLIVFEPTGLSESFTLKVSETARNAQRSNYVIISEGNGKIHMSRKS